MSKKYVGIRHGDRVQVWVLDGHGGRVLDPVPTVEQAVLEDATGMHVSPPPVELMRDFKAWLEVNKEKFNQGCWFINAEAVDVWLKVVYRIGREPLTAAEHGAFPGGRWT